MLRERVTCEKCHHIWMAQYETATGKELLSPLVFLEGVDKTFTARVWYAWNVRCTGREVSECPYCCDYWWTIVPQWVAQGSAMQFLWHPEDVKVHQMACIECGMPIMAHMAVTVEDALCPQCCLESVPSEQPCARPQMTTTLAGMRYDLMKEIDTEGWTL